MTNNEAALVLLNIAQKGKKAYHAGYDRSVEYAREARAYFAGVGVDKFLEQFTRRESPELFEQRKKITAHVQKSLGYALDRPFSKVRRSNWIKVLSVEGDTDGKKALKFERETLARFTKRGLDGYVFERVKYWNEVDPNTFIVIEVAPFDNTKERARPYAFEVTADMAVDFRFDPNGELQYLVCRQDQEKPNGDSMQSVERLTIYQPRQTLVLQQLTDAEVKALLSAPPLFTELSSLVQDGQVFNLDNRKYYRLDIPTPHGWDRTPAVRAGYIDNPEDDGATCVSIFDAAMPFAKKALKLNSETDLTMALMAFPISVRYEDPCDAVGCKSGNLVDGSVCLTCSGTGKKSRPTSAQEEIVLDMPDRPEDMFDLTRILNYVSPPTEAIRLQLETLAGYFQQAKEAVYNSQMFTKQEVAQTATYHGIELQAIYDTLFPYAQHLSGVWRFLVDACRAFTKSPEKIIANLVFPQDFRFETAEDLFAELQSAREAGAGNAAATILQGRIMERLLIDEPEQLKRSRVDARFDPFPGMTPDEVVVALNSSLVPEWKKILWANYAGIVDDILVDTPVFYELEYSRQRGLIMEEVKAIQDEIRADRPTFNIGAIADRATQPDATE